MCININSACRVNITFKNVIFIFTCEDVPYQLFQLRHCYMTSRRSIQTLSLSLKQIVFVYTVLNRSKRHHSV